MKWEIDGTLDVVQACVERARDIIERHEWRCQLSETSASREYRFDSTTVGELGSLKLSILPHGRTELYGYSPPSPNDAWLTPYLLKNTSPDQMSKPLRGLLSAFAWQMEAGVFDRSAEEYYLMAFSSQKVLVDWKKFGLGRERDRFRALRELDRWRAKILSRREYEFGQISGVIESEVRYAQLRITKWVDGAHQVDESPAPESAVMSMPLRRPPGRPRLPDDIWAWEQVILGERPPADVFREWRGRDGVKARDLRDPGRHFKRITKPEWGRKPGQNN